MDMTEEQDAAKQLESLKSYSQLPVEAVGPYGYRFTIFDDAHRSEKKLCTSFAEAINFALGIYSGRRIEVSERAAAMLVPITTERYAELLESEMFLNALQGAGVDNWEGYSEAQEAMDAE